MKPIEKAVYLLCLNELGQITSAEIRKELGLLVDAIKDLAEFEQEAPPAPPPPAY